MPPISRSSPKPLRIWKEISPSPTPVKEPSRNAPHVLIIGGGVTGLVTAWTLLDSGKRVTIISKEWASLSGKRLTSQVAGALWEYPPAVCGQHEGKVSLQESKRWSMVTYPVLTALADDPELSIASGIRMRAAGFYFPMKIEEDQVQTTKMLEIMASGVRGFNRGAHVIHQHGINPAQITDAYEIDSPVIDTDQAMHWLMGLVQGKGARFVTEEINSDLFHVEADLLSRFNADAVVNATGLGAAITAADESCYPVRGALWRAINSGPRGPKLDTCFTLSADVAGSNEIVFIVPRNDDVLLLGGVAEDREGKLDLTTDSPLAKRMLDRCREFLPSLRNVELQPTDPFVQGLRPFRGGNVRVERELREHEQDQKSGTRQPSRIIHSYGQGGSGWTLSFGCAADVLRLVEETLRGEAARPMAKETAPIPLDHKPLIPTRTDRSHVIRARL